MLASAPRLLRVTSPDRHLDRELLHARGGFAWWYLDALDERGNGLTAIWSFGLPFLPGYESAARRGAAVAPRERPSLNVVAYAEGRELFYLLQEHPEHDASWSAGGESWTFGETRIVSEVTRGRRHVRLDLDCAIPGSDERLRGVVTLDGVSRRPVPHAPVTLSDHDWSPLTGPSEVRAALRVGDRRLLDLEGRGYHDRNGSRTPFSSLGIRHWIWGRVPARDHELVYYLLWPGDGGPPEAVGLEIDRGGATASRSLEVRLERPRRARFGMPYWERVALTHGGRPWLDVRHEAPIDDGPFYLRAFTEARAADGERARGTGELVRPRRVDLAAWRPFVEMRVHHTERPRSRLNPLFCGPRATRLSRQLGALLGRTARVG